MIRSFIASSLVLLCASVFDAAVLSNITFLPSIPDLPLLCVLFFSIQNGKILGESTGFVSGLFMDFLSACPFGLNCLLRTIIGYLGGIFNKELNIEGFFIPVFLGACATVVKALLVLLFSFLFRDIVVPYKIISISFAFELGANALLTPFVFNFLRLFRNSIVMKPENIYQ